MKKTIISISVLLLLIPFILGINMTSINHKSSMVENLLITQPVSEVNATTISQNHNMEPQAEKKKAINKMKVVFNTTPQTNKYNFHVQTTGHKSQHAYGLKIKETKTNSINHRPKITIKSDGINPNHDQTDTSFYISNISNIFYNHSYQINASFGDVHLFNQTNSTLEINISEPKKIPTKKLSFFIHPLQYIHKLKLKIKSIKFGSLNQLSP